MEEAQDTVIGGHVFGDVWGTGVICCFFMNLGLVNATKQKINPVPYLLLSTMAFCDGCVQEMVPRSVFGWIASARTLTTRRS